MISLELDLSSLFPTVYYDPLMGYQPSSQHSFKLIKQVTREYTIHQKKVLTKNYRNAEMTWHLQLNLLMLLCYGPWDIGNKRIHSKRLLMLFFNPTYIQPTPIIFLCRRKVLAGLCESRPKIYTLMLNIVKLTFSPNGHVDSIRSNIYLPLYIYLWKFISWF